MVNTTPQKDGIVVEQHQHEGRAEGKEVLSCLRVKAVDIRPVMPIVL